MRKPDIKRVILRMAGKGEFYGYEIHKQLAEENIRVGIGRLYAILTEMRNEGLLKDRWQKSQSGPRRRVYQIGKKGRREREKMLMEAIGTVHEFYTEYLLNLPPELSAFSKMSKLLSMGLREKPVIAYAAPRFSEPLKRVLAGLRTENPGSTMYIVCSRSAANEPGLENLLILEGSLEDIPAKDNYLDLLIVTGNIRTDSLEACFTEWHRVLRKDGTLAIVTPTALVASFEEPLGIGDFIERKEHPRTGERDHLSLEVLTQQVGRHFDKVEHEQVVHITVLRGLKPKAKPQ
ncbi:MAG: helix-turn-helix transcriptional regulator [Candidatus Thorarchaeota archaeon]